MRNQYNPYDNPPSWGYQPPPRRDPVATTLLLGALLLGALAAVAYFGAAPLRSLLRAPAPVVAPAPATFPAQVQRPPVAQPAQPAPVPQAEPPEAVAPNSDKVQRPNLRPLPTLAPAPQPIIVIPAPTIPAGVNLHVGTDGASLSIQNDPPAPAVEYHTEAVEAPNTKVSKPSTRRLPPKGE
jgi:hypothetical protein